MAYQPGQIALHSRPFVYVTEFSIRSRVCEFCLEFKSDEENSLKKCSKCKMIYYCDISCQKESWISIHQQECQYLRKFRQNDNILTDTIRMIIRTIIKSQNNVLRRAQSFTSLKADLCQDISGGFAFSRCLNGTFL